MNYLLNEHQLLQLELVTAHITLLSQLAAAATGKQLQLDTNAFTGVLHQVRQLLQEAMPATPWSRPEFAKGVIVTLSGITGSGKTTLMHVIAQCLKGHGIEVSCEDDGQLVTEPYSDLKIGPLWKSPVLLVTAPLPE